MTHIYIKPSSNQRSITSREASAAGRLRPNAVTGQMVSRAETMWFWFTATVWLRYAGHNDLAVGNPAAFRHI